MSNEVWQLTESTSKLCIYNTALGFDTVLENHIQSCVDLPLLGLLTRCLCVRAQYHCLFKDKEGIVPVLVVCCLSGLCLAVNVVLLKDGEATCSFCPPED